MEDCEAICHICGNRTYEEAYIEEKLFHKGEIFDVRVNKNRCKKCGYEYETTYQRMITRNWLDVLWKMKKGSK